MTNPRIVDVAAAVEFAEHLESHADELVEVLTQHESHETALDELERSVHTLRGLHREMHYLRVADVDSAAAFLPVNLPLYSLVLFAAVPSLMSRRVFVRSPAVAPQWVRDVFEVSRMSEHFPRIGLYDLQRRDFLEHFVSDSEVVLFTGRHVNAMKVQQQCPQATFVFNGAGVNPVVVGPDADIAASLDRIVAARVFNSGQDCAGPDALLVHASRAEEFVESLRAALGALEVGDYSDPSVRIGPILNPGPLPALLERLEALQDSTRLDGVFDLERQIVEPHLIVRPLSEHDRLVEFFAPVFYVLVWDDDEELAGFFLRPEYSDNAMYVSVFGAPLLPEMVLSSNPLVDLTVLEVEHGNEPYGGWGRKANYVVNGENFTVGPVLVSAAMATRTDRRGRGGLIVRGERRGTRVSR